MRQWTMRIIIALGGAIIGFACRQIVLQGAYPTIPVCFTQSRDGYIRTGDVQIEYHSGSKICTVFVDKYTAKTFVK